MTDELTLAAEFPAPSRDDWLALVDKVLKGGDFTKKLVSRTPDGLDVQPLYTDGPTTAGLPGFPPHTRGSSPAPRVGGAWDIRVLVDHPDVTVANATLLDELLRGATSLLVRVGPGGTPVASVDDLDRLLDGVYLDLLPVAFEPGADFVAVTDWVRALWERRGVGGAEVSGSLGIDPLGAIAAGASLDATAALAQAGELAAATAAATPGVRALAVDTGVYAEAGATPGQQLAALLASGVSLLRSAELAGLSPTEAASQIEARLVVDADFFGSIVLCRAARRVWAALLAECGVDAADRGLHLQVRTAARMMSDRDPWVNLLRVTSATFGAALGGADGILALPFDSELGLPDDLGRRLARNTQLLLQEESNVGRVLDPAGGAWYLETLTEQLATLAWDLFTDIESRGGMAAVLADGSFAEAIDAAWQARQTGIATRRIPLTGVSEFPLITEAPVVRPERPTVVTDGLPRRHDAESFQTLRSAADEYRAANGSFPKVFLANLGPVASHTARATWALNFFETAGIEAVTNDGFADAEAAATAFAASGATIACLCSSDAVYAELAAPVSAALLAAGATRLYLAGNPGEARSTYEAAGISEFVHVGVDLIDVLTRAQQTLGVTQ